MQFTKILYGDPPGFSRWEERKHAKRGLPCGTPFWRNGANPATKGIRYEVAPVGEVVLDKDACWFNVAVSATLPRLPVL